MTLLIHLLQYWLHLSEITVTDTRDNDQYRNTYLIDYQCITTLHMYSHVYVLCIMCIL